MPKSMGMRVGIGEYLVAVLYLKNSWVLNVIYSYYGLTMWFPTMFERMDSANATSVCDLPPPTQGNKSTCDFSNQQQVYLETFIQTMSNLPGHLIYLLLIEAVGRKLLLGEIFKFYITKMSLHHKIISLLNTLIELVWTS